VIATLPHGQTRGIVSAALLVTGTLFVLGGVGLALTGSGPGGPSLVPSFAGAVWETPAPSPSATAAVPAGVPMPEGADCLACHAARDGTIGSNAIPVIAHPIDGWRACTGCHSTDRLVATAPGHSGIHAADCLTCHTKSTPAAPARPHAADQNIACTQCHGPKVALPADHAGRTETTCWLCHPASYAEAPKLPHPIPTDRTCRSCHYAGGVGALPATHVTRSDTTCTLCHQLSPSAPIAPHDLGAPSGQCSTCHGQPQALGRPSSSAAAVKP
jgi:hypothetical protein